MESDRLPPIQKLVAIAHVAYDDNPTMEHLAKAAGVELEAARRIVLQLVQSSWLTLNEEHIKILIEQIVSHQIESERQSEREYFGLARYETDAADELEAILEAAGYVLKESEESIEWLEVHWPGADPGVAGVPVLTFDIGNWAWQPPQPARGENREVDGVQA